MRPAMRPQLWCVTQRATQEPSSKGNHRQASPRMPASSSQQHAPLSSGVQASAGTPGYSSHIWPCSSAAHHNSLGSYCSMPSDGSQMRFRQAGRQRAMHGHVTAAACSRHAGRAPLQMARPNRSET
eukprot:jgi/Ulvmu1/6562/UM003_0199.1